ncbi:MAG: hypothetical protein FD143_3771, partial [Ignavibacteria bacterium]
MGTAGGPSIRDAAKILEIGQHLVASPREMRITIQMFIYLFYRYTI